MGRTDQVMKSHERTEPEALQSPPGIVIHQPGLTQPRPSIFAFIWGGKVRPVPALPYGRRPA